jgi:hypothetical protein
MSYNISKNLAQSTLASSYAAGATTITVQTGDGAKFDAAPFVIALNNPPDFFLEVTAVASDTFTVDTSGFDSSTPINEASNVQVTEVITAGVLQALLAAASPVLGTAIFDSVGSITSLVTTGNVTGVTYNSTGNYSVALSGSPSNYLVHVQLSNDSGTYIGVASIIYNSVGTSGFKIQTIQLNGGGFTVHDFPIVMVTVLNQS